MPAYRAKRNAHAANVARAGAHNTSETCKLRMRSAATSVVPDRALATHTPLFVHMYVRSVRW